MNIFAPNMYHLLRQFLFLFDAEKVHHFSMNSLRLLCSIPAIKSVLKKMYSPENFPVKSFGLTFRNHIGLAAGFDKNAKYLRELEVLGFGFVEIGTVTPVAQDGNPKPRLFRLPKDKAIINRMGFNNDGVEVIIDRLKKYRISIPKNKNATYPLIIGGNIGKNKNTPNENAWQDYETCFTALHDVVDYFVVNVSSPNTPGLRDLQQKESLRKILTNLQRLNVTKEFPKPLLLKIAPDLTPEALDEVIDLAIEIKLDGLVAANTTIKRKNLLTDEKAIEKIGNGGLSGKPLNEKNNRITNHIFLKTKG
ncbi:MAG: quinone-dependent dihydroorotate dehydrogenase, partial [Ginsengibacter sp.]